MAIYLDREGVDSTVKQIGQAIEALQDAAKRVDNEVMGNLGNSWQGDAYNKTIDTYASEYQKMLTVDVPELVSQLSQFIDNCKNAIVEVDRQLSGG